MNKKGVARKFDEEAQYYDEYMPKIIDVYLVMIERIIELARPKNTDTVLDLGTGTGAISFKLAPKVKKVVARDISEKMLQVAREKALKNKVKNIDFGYGSFSEPNCGQKVNLIVSNLAFHHLYDEEKQEAIKVWHNLLKPGGRVILGDVMWFFDNRKYPEKEEEQFRVIAEWSRSMDSQKSLEEKIEEKKREDHPANVYDLKSFFEEEGFIVEGIEEIKSPLMGIMHQK